MQTKTCSRGIIVGVSVLAISVGWQVPVAAQDVGEAASPQAQAPARTADPRSYYVDFRSRTAASNDHGFVWYGRTDQRAVEVAGLHPASDSPVPYILGHIIPVPSETGRSYGDLDEQYLTASYRVVMTKAEAQPVFAYIKRLQASSPTWGPHYNCIVFLRDIAQHMGLKVPNPYFRSLSEKWINELRELNGGKENQVVKFSDIRAGTVPKSTQAAAAKPKPSLEPKPARTAAAALVPSMPDPGRSW
jgi:hypothetical protein